MSQTPLIDQIAQRVEHLLLRLVSDAAALRMLLIDLERMIGDVRLSGSGVGHG